MGDTNSRQHYEHGQDIRDRTFAFACRVVKCCDQVYKAGGVGRLLVPQLVNCSTSTATMLEEARAAESDADFVSKCCVGLKECRESWTRLRIFVECGIGPSADTRALVIEASELIAIVTSIIQNKRSSMKKASAIQRGSSRIAQRLMQASSPQPGPP
jgi:four helix bundle protein